MNPFLDGRGVLPEGIDPVEAPPIQAQSPPAVPTPAPQGYSPSPSSISNFPGLSSPDSLRQAYGRGVRVRRWLPIGI